MTKPPRDLADKPKDLPLDKASTVGREGTEEGVVVIAAGTPGGAPAPSNTITNTSKPGSPAALSPSPSAPDQKRAGLDVTSQGVQTTSTFSGPKHEEKEEKKEAVQEWVEGKVWFRGETVHIFKSGDNLYLSYYQPIQWKDQNQHWLDPSMCFLLFSNSNILFFRATELHCGSKTIKNTSICYTLYRVTSSFITRDTGILVYSITHAHSAAKNAH